MESNEPRVLLILGSGATRGGGFRAHIEGSDFEVPMDRNFWRTPAVHSVFTADSYPALHHYREQVGGSSLEETWAYVDMLLKLCLSRVVSEESDDEAKAALRQRMTTVAAERSLREMGRRGARRREVVDQSAATILLQGYLDAKKGERWTDPSA